MPDQQQGWQWPNLKAMDFLQKVKYGGPVGKKAAIAMVALIVVAVSLPVAGWLGLTGAVYVALGLIVVIFFGAMRSIDTTVERFPELAMMDGMEVVAYKKVALAAKNQPSIPDTPRMIDPNPANPGIEGPEMEDT